VYSYTISSANTWEYKTVVIVGDTTGTWLTTNGIGLRVWWTLAAGSSLTASAGSWIAGDKYGVTGTTSVVGTSGATFYITGVQLEAGSVATPFERRPFGTELALCQRYYYKLTASATGVAFGNCYLANTTLALGVGTYPVTMRTAPSALEQSGTATDYQVRHVTTSTVCSAVPSFVTGSENVWYTQFTAASGFTAGNAGVLRAATSSAFLAWSAEL
jgi:hypothetical protein